MRRIFGELNKTEKIFFRGKSTISLWLIVQGKFETKAQILAMRLAVACSDPKKLDFFETT